MGLIKGLAQRSSETPSLVNIRRHWIRLVESHSAIPTTITRERNTITTGTNMSAPTRGKNWETAIAPTMTYQINTEVAGLDLAQPIADTKGGIGQSVHQPINDIVIKSPNRPADHAGDFGNAIHDKVDDMTIKGGTEPADGQGASDGCRVVEFRQYSIC